MSAIGTTQHPRRRRAGCRSIGRFARVAVLVTCAGLLAAACTSSANSGSGANAPAFTTTASWGPTSWTYNPFTLGKAYFPGLGVQLPLAIPEKTTNQTQLLQLIPQLMTSYSLTSNNVFTIHLVKGARFSDGEPVDATDVVDSILVKMVDEGFVYDHNIENVTAPDSTTVVITFTPNTPNVNAKGAVMAVIPLPMSQYGQFLPPGMEQALLAYNKLIQNPRTAATAESSPLYKKIEPYYKKLVAYSPAKLIGDGPFMVTGANTSSMTEVKSPSYFGASQVHVDALTLLNTASSSSNVYAQLFSHEIDWYGGATPSSTELSQWKATSGANEVSVDDNVTENMLFNNKAYPFTLTPVRQAIAYLINRTTLAETEDGGTLTSNRPDSLPDGLGAVLNGIWLSASQRSQLNPYTYSPSKATALLESAGFKKAGGRWMMPNGQRFKTQVIAPSSPESAALFPEETAAELTAFGISATASTVPTVSYDAQYEKGDFQIGWVNGVNGNLEPVCGIANGGLGAPTNYAFGTNGAISGAVTAGEPGIGFGPTYDVPGQGVVGVSQTVTAECQDANAGPQLAADAWDWAQVVNKEVPFLSYADDDAVMFYSSGHYTNWPPASSYLWQEAAIGSAQGPATLPLELMIEHGYISPKR
jgi:peptide/nickel transport system substrate-binding protein